MPTSLHPQAKFDPIPPDLDLHSLVDQTPNFKWVQRVSRSQILSLGQQGFEKLVQIHVIGGGKPLVIDGWDALLPKWLFSVDWLEKSYDKKQENVRDLPTGTDIPMTTGHYLRSMTQLTNQWTPQNFRDERRQRLYLKDIDCPIEWRDELQTILHPNLFYLNGNVATSGSLEAARRLPGVEKNGSDVYCDESAVAPAGDLMSSLPEEMRAQNLMCYVGHEGTYTPAHREMCASVGHNIMVEASCDRKGERPGSSIWFMTESKDRDVVREYFLSMLGHDIEIEKHFAQINAWKKAPFDVYLVDQHAGDFIIIPPLAAHQVWNRGTRTMKVAWNRTTPETLRLALREALPNARLVCRDEQYKNKAIIYFTLQKYYQLLKEMERQEEITTNSFMGIGKDIVRNSPRTRQLAGDFKSLFNLFTEVLIDEAFAYKEKEVERLAFDSCVTCSYCRSNIFNRFLTCKHCTRTLVDGDEDAYDVCMECYAMGRSCACLSGLQWCEQWSWPDLSAKYEIWREMVIQNDGFVDLHSSPPPFEVARQLSAKKSVAQICQEALIRRPWKDITKQDYGKAPSDTEQGDVEEGPKKKTKRKPKQGEVRRCHVCCHKDYSYRVHECCNSECAEAYCYGVLYRAFDMMPQTVLQDENWQCPKCLGICNCGHCRRAGNTNPYTPKNTSLGHDTRPIADDRSIEALVDFRVHNLSWLKAAGEESRSRDSRRMQRLRQQADHAKARGALDGIEDNGPLLGEGDIYQTAVDPDTQSGETEAQDVDADSATAAAIANLPAESAETQPNSFLDRPSVTHDAGSPYPDPSLSSNYGIGMGYYEQDDSPDRILFNPYEVPPISAIQLVDLEVPDSVKKSIRAAKRKAKKENEDPDFIVGRSSHKKARHTSRGDILDNMDPALFIQEASTATPTTLRQNASQASTSVDFSPEKHYEPLETAPKRSTALTTSNEPALRHARPLASYVEVDDIDIEEVESGSSHKITTGEGTVSHIEQDQNLEDQDSFDPPKVSTLKSKPSSLAEQLGPLPGGKRRGRPPKRRSQTGPTLQEAGSNVSVDMTPAATFVVAQRRPGRPRKSMTAPNLMDLATEAIATTLQEPDEALKEADPTSNTTPGKSQKSEKGSSTWSASQLHRADIPSRGITKAVRSPKRINAKDGADGLPQRRSAIEGKRSRSNAIIPSSKGRHHLMPVNQTFLSMAERLALRGRSFKIGKRRNATGYASLDDEDDESGTSEASGPAAADCSKPKSRNTHREEQTRHNESPSRRCSQTDPPVHGTVVKLTELVSSEDEYESIGDQTILSSDDSGNSDIPARGEHIKQAPSSESASPNQGPGRLRGRARGRGRPRGRGRGRGRGRAANL